MEDFILSVTNSEHKKIEDLVKCNNACCSASNSAKITFFEGLDCSGDATLDVTHSATIEFAQIFHLPYLKCKTLTINASHSSTVKIHKLDCDELILNVAFSSTVSIDTGWVGKASGTISLASTGVCHASIKGADDVKADSTSKWVT